MEEKPELDFVRKIKLDYSPIHNIGVFATENIAKDEIIEVCPMIILAHRMNYHHDPVIREYCFSQVCPCEECKNHGGHLIMNFGYGSMYNHHDNNNAKISFDLRNHITTIRANRDIKKGEEIFITYGEKYFTNRTQNEITKVRKLEVESKIDPKIELKAETMHQVDNVFKPL